mmetsp:Transcript_34006/g.54507  ORF Transcript_34006/g.54507 Transcript_34006/m.54507 type:complete len:91 (+) Transcript_34006:238-510(+)
MYRKDDEYSSRFIADRGCFLSSSSFLFEQHAHEQQREHEQQHCSIQCMKRLHLPGICSLSALDWFLVDFKNKMKTATIKPYKSGNNNSSQ